jgi:membrane-associated phospholipid phosphatase
MTTPDPARTRPGGAGRRDPGTDTMLGAVLLGAGAALTAGLVSGRTRAAVQDVDDRWYALVQRSRTPPLGAASRVLDVALGTGLDWTARLALTALLVRQRRWPALASWATTVALGEVSVGPLKGRIRRPRPAAPIVTTSATSYPSGHALAAATTLPGAVLALLPAGPQRDRALAAAVTVAAATALSRTYLNAHWLSDAVGGFCLGTAYSLLVPRVVDSIRPDR